MKCTKKTNWIFIIVSIGILSIGNANAIPIIDIDSRVDGLSNSVDRLLGPGTYTINAVGVAGGGAWDAWNAWGYTSCSDQGGCQRTRPTTVMGWLNSYSFASSDLAYVSINGSVASPVTGDRYSVNPYITFPDALSALAHAWSAEFTLNVASTVSFMIQDSVLTDNQGGMSLNVSLNAAPQRSGIVPEPSIMALMVLGFVGIGVSHRKKA